MRKQNLAVGLLCLAISLAAAAMDVVAEPEMKTNSPIDYARLAIPFTLFVGVLIWMKAAVMLDSWAFWLLLASSPCFVLAINWSAIFCLTDYRAHRGSEILLLAASYFVFYFGVLFAGASRSESDSL